MMKEGIKHTDLNQEFLTSEGCHIIEISNSEDDPHLSIARARVSPGVTTRWHRLKNTAERYYILSGRATVEIGHLPSRKVTPGDIVLIPPECRQRITNTGADDLIFLAICTPRFSEKVYEDIEEG